MAVSRDRVRDEDDVAVIIGDHERPVPGRLVLSGPEVLRSGPRPAGPQRTVYQGDRTPRGLLGLFGRPTPLSHGSSMKFSARSTRSSSCTLVRPDIRHG